MKNPTHPFRACGIFHAGVSHVCSAALYKRRASEVSPSDPYPLRCAPQGKRGDFNHQRHKAAAMALRSRTLWRENISAGAPSHQPTFAPLRFANETLPRFPSPTLTSCATLHKVSAEISPAVADSGMRSA